MRQTSQGLSKLGQKHQLAWEPTSRLLLAHTVDLYLPPHQTPLRPTVVLGLRTLRHQQHGVCIIWGVSDDESRVPEYIYVALWSYQSTESGLGWESSTLQDFKLSCVLLAPPLGF